MAEEWTGGEYVADLEGGGPAYVWTDSAGNKLATKDPNPPSTPAGLPAGTPMPASSVAPSAEPIEPVAKPQDIYSIVFPDGRTANVPAGAEKVNIEGIDYQIDYSGGLESPNIIGAPPGTTLSYLAPIGAPVAGEQQYIHKYQMKELTPEAQKVLKEQGIEGYNLYVEDLQQQVGGYKNLGWDESMGGYVWEDAQGNKTLTPTEVPPIFAPEVMVTMEQEEQETFYKLPIEQQIERYNQQIPVAEEIAQEKVQEQIGMSIQEAGGNVETYRNLPTPEEKQDYYNSLFVTVGNNEKMIKTDYDALPIDIKETIDKVGITGYREQVSSYEATLAPYQTTLAAMYGLTDEDLNNLTPTFKEQYLAPYYDLSKITLEEAEKPEIREAVTAMYPSLNIEQLGKQPLDSNAYEQLKSAHDRNLIGKYNNIEIADWYKYYPITAISPTEYQAKKASLISSGLSMNEVNKTMSNYYMATDSIEEYQEFAKNQQLDVTFQPSMWQRMTPWQEQYGESVTLQGGTTMAMEILVPFYFVTTNWSDLSPSARGVNIAIDVVSLIPFIGAATLGARGVGIASRLARVAAVGKAVGRELGSQAIAPVTMVIHPIGTVKATYRTVADLLEDVFDPMKVGESVLTTSNHTVKLRIGKDITLAEARAIGDELVNALQTEARQIGRTSNVVIEITTSGSTTNKLTLNSLEELLNSLPPVKEGYVRVVHSSDKAFSDLIRQKGLHFYNDIDNTAVVIKGDKADIEYMERFTRKGGSTSIFDIPESEYNKFSGKTPLSEAEHLEMGKGAWDDFGELEKRGATFDDYYDAIEAEYELLLEKYYPSKTLKQLTMAEKDFIESQIQIEKKLLAGTVSPKYLVGQAIDSNGKFILETTKLGASPSGIRIEFAQSPLMKEVGGGVTSGTPFGEEWMRQVDEQGFAVVSSKSEGGKMYFSLEPHSRFAFSTAGGIEGTSPTMLVFDKESTLFKNIEASQKLYKAPGIGLTKEIEVTAPAGTIVLDKVPEQILYTRVGVGREVMEIWLTKPLTARQLAKLKALNLIERVKAPFKTPVKVTRIGEELEGLTEAELRTLADIVDEAGNIQVARRLRAVANSRDVFTAGARVSRTVSLDRFDPVTGRVRSIEEPRASRDAGRETLISRQDIIGREPMRSLSERKAVSRMEPERIVPSREVPARDIDSREVTRIEPTRAEPPREEPVRDIPPREIPLREVPPREIPAREEPTQFIPLREVDRYQIPDDDEASYKQLTQAEKEGSVAWRQGIMYKLIYPPYGQEHIINSRKPFPNMKIHTGAESAFKTLVQRGKGKLPNTIKRDMGIMDITITTGGGKGKKPKMKYKLDRYQQTDTTPRITRM